MIDGFMQWVPWCVVAYAVAAVLRPVLRWPRGPRAAALLLAGSGLLALPVVVPGEFPLSRALVAIFAGTFVIKIYDLYRHGPVPSWPAYLLFLVNPFCHVYRRLEAAPVPTTRQNFVRLGRGVILIAAGAAAFKVFTAPETFLLEHAWKVTAGFLIVYGGAEIAFALWTQAGLRGIPQFQNFFLARTPADFWRRYNRPVTQYMFENVFRPVGGARAPVRATLAAFFAAGVLHEYMADIALQSVQGFQLAFFMVQGAAVAATQRLKLRGRAAVFAGIAATLLFNILVTVLFVASAAQMFDFYSGNAPAWIHAR